MRQLLNIVQEIIDIFHKEGRGRVYNDVTNQGNPAVSSAVNCKLYLKCTKEKQAKAHVLPKQAKPFFLSKLQVISEYINNRLDYEGINLIELYVL